MKKRLLLPIVAVPMLWSGVACAQIPFLGFMGMPHGAGMSQAYANMAATAGIAKAYGVKGGYGSKSNAFGAQIISMGMLGFAGRQEGNFIGRATVDGFAHGAMTMGTSKIYSRTGKFIGKLSSKFYGAGGRFIGTGLSNPYYDANGNFITKQAHNPYYDANGNFIGK